MAKSTQGTCEFCGETFSKRAMTKHLNTCPQRSKKVEALSQNKKAKTRTLTHLSIEGAYLPMYWLYIEVPSDQPLSRLDQFLRDIWLECCGHLSAFEIGGQRYSVHPMPDFKEKGMGTKIGDVFTKGSQADYEYDFGSTTELRIPYVDQREGAVTSTKPVLLARNLPPEILCDECGQPATQLCTECMWDDAGRLCAEHAEEHACGEDMLLPVVNSPRVGVCGYTGPLE